MKKISLLFLAFISFSSCVKDDDFSIPSLECENKWTANSTIKELIDNLDNTPKTITTKTFIEGVVISNDQTGNFYNELIIQDKSTNPERGIKLSINKGKVSQDFPLGSHIIVNTEGLSVGKYKGIPVLGKGISNNSVDRIEPNTLYDIVSRTCEPISPIQAKAYDDITSLTKTENLNTFIQLNDVYFEKGGVDHFHDANSKFNATNNYLIDKKGKKIAVRTSKYADFAKETLPKGVGSIKAILGGYDSNGKGLTSSKYQLTIVAINDINFDPNVKPKEPTNEPEKPSTGNDSDKKYFTCLNEDFSSYNNKETKFSSYTNYYISGKKWAINEYKGAKSLQLSAFKSKKDVKTYFIIPIDFDKADSFSFKTKDGYFNGETLSIYWVSDFSDLKNLDLSHNITSEFTISKNNTKGYAKDFVPSGEFSLANLTGKGAIVFVYEGGPTSKKTTTYQIDDIRVMDKDDANCK